MSDDETPSGSLVVTVTAAPPGLAISNLTNSSGVISATVAAACNAAIGTQNVTLQVTDGDGLPATGTLIVNVTANTPPEMGNYLSPVSLMPGAGTTVIPDSPPTDNGSIISLTASASGFTGGLGGNLATGAITISNAGPVGSFTVTVTAMDNCGAATTRSFQLTVQGSADLAITKNGTPGPVSAGDRLTWQITVTNLGPVTASGITMTDTLPAGTSFQNCAATGGGVCGGTGSNRTVTFPTLNINATVTVTLTAIVTASAHSVLRNTATVSSAVSDPDLSNNSATATTPLKGSDCTPPDCPEAGPGTVAPPTSSASSQKPGSALIYNLYTSSASNPGAENTRINLTNTDPGRTVFVHLFFVEGGTCSAANTYLCLTPNQTVALLASDVDPGVTGYLVVVAVDKTTGCPVQFNALIGDAYVRFSSGQAANLNAESFAAVSATPAACDGASATATLAFDGAHYNPAPRVLVVDAIASLAEGNATMLIINRLGGDLSASAASVGSLFGLLFDDLEQSHSFTVSAGSCQFKSLLSASFPRTTPRIGTVIPAGHSGWMKLWATGDAGLLGAALNFNPNAHNTASAWQQGRNLHALTHTTAPRLTIPISPPTC